MIKLALIGKNISHSKSPQIYRGFLGDNVDYQLLDYNSRNEIPTAQELMMNYRGVSITAPYKDHFLTQVRVAPEVQSLGAINCLYKESGAIYGTNTDLTAMREIIQRDLAGKDWRVIILGSGAMSRVTRLALEENQISYDQFSRSTTSDLSKLDLKESFKTKCLIINCCAREFEFCGSAPSGSHYWDLNYSRANEKKSIESLGLTYHDGEELLFLQAKHALRMWKLKKP